MIDPTAEVSPGAQIGARTRIWGRTHVREQAVIGDDCIVGECVYIDIGVKIGSRVKIQNAALVYQGTTIEDGVFVGPRVCFTNDRVPRAINPDGSLKSLADWTVGKTLVREGASIGAGVVVLPDVTVGRFAMVAAAAVVTASVPDHGLAVGVPARTVGWVCRCGARLAEESGSWRCPRDGWQLHPEVP